MLCRICLLQLFCIALIAPAAEAANRTWPGAAPCAATLQACVDGSAAGDTVQVAQNSVIDESIVVNKPLTLRAALGYRPILEAGRVISGSVNVAGNWRWQVEGFELREGFISLTIQGGTEATVVLRGNRIRAAISGAAEMSIYKPSTAATDLVYEVFDNDLNYYWNTFDGSLRAALQILDRGTGNTRGRIRENRVDASGGNSIGILVSTEDRNHRTEVLGNRIRGGRDGSIQLRQGSLTLGGSGSLQAFVLNNVVRSVAPQSRQAKGIAINAFGGSLSLMAMHNTVVDAQVGLDVFVATGVACSGEVAGNLFAYLNSSGLQRSGAGCLSDRDNLFFQTSETPATPGLSASSLFFDPMLRLGVADPHLSQASPAANRLNSDSLSTLLDAESLPYTDGDGLRRFKRANYVDGKSNVLDIGALEEGDDSVLYRVPSTSPGLTQLVFSAYLDGYSNALPQAIGNWNPDRSTGIYNNHPVSLRYSPASARWQLRQEDLQPFSASAAFNFFAPGEGEGRYLHLPDAGNTGGSLTELNRAGLNGRDDAILLVTRNPGIGTVVDVTSPLAVNYFSGVWSIVRLDGLNMPIIGGFNVYFQEPSSNAYRHRTSAGNTFGNGTTLDHPLLNGSPCARVHVAQATDFGISNNHHIGVYYIGGTTARWAIFNQDLAAIPVGVNFHVVVDPSAISCADALFANGFE